MRSAGSALGFLLSITAAPAQQYVISTIAGGVPPPTPTLGTSMPIPAPRDVATDAAGNVYFTNLHCVFKLDQSGIVTRVAGNSGRGYSGDGGPATNAQLNYPSGIAVDGAGNLFIMDSDNRRVRKVSPSGIITTMAGGGSSPSAGDGGPATEDAQMVTPGGVAVDGAGNLFIADFTAGRIRKVSASGIITTVAGGGQLSGDLADGGPATEAAIRPGALAVNSVGDVFFTDSETVRKVSTDGIITTVAGNPTGATSGDGGPATSAYLDIPEGVAVDRAGNLFIAEWNGLRIRKVSPDGIISTLAGGGTTAGFSGDGGPAANAQLDRPAGVAVDDAGNVFITDLGNNRIRKVAASGIISTVAGNGSSSALSGDSGPATNAQLSNPTDVAPDAMGNLFIVDYGNGRIRKMSPDGIITTFVDYGTLNFPRDGLPAPATAKPNASGELILADPYHGRVVKLSNTGTLTTIAGGGADQGDGEPATSAALGFPSGIALDSRGDLFILDPSSERVRRVSPDGIITTVAGNGFLVFGGDGGPATNAFLSEPSGVATDSSGNLFIAEWGSRSIRKVSANGIITTVARTSARPGSVTADAAGNLFFLDVDGVRKVSPNGAITTIAGGGNCWPCNSAPATSALLFAVSLAADNAGNIYVADAANNTVRLLRPTNHSVLVGAVVDAASQSVAPLSPGKIVDIYGAGLGPSQLTQPNNGQPGTSLGGTTAAFNGIAATILYASATRVTAVVPYALTGTTAQATVAYQGETSAALSLPLAPSSPSIFTSNQSGAGQATAINAVDGTINTAANPVKIGGYITLYATGEGQTMVSPGGAPPRPVLPVTVTIGGIPATVQYAGGLPGQVTGVMQVIVQIPPGVEPGGYVHVVLQVGDVSTTEGAVWIAVVGN